jgi:hypothetical protein
VDRTVFIAAEFHGITSVKSGDIVAGRIGIGPENLSISGTATIPGRGGIMPNLTAVVRQLKKERQRLQGEMERLNAAMAALRNLGNLAGHSKGSLVAIGRRTMSVAARKRIAAAQRARWAKWKAAKRNR